MEFTIPTFIAYISAWLGIMGGIWALFDRAEIVLRKDIRKQLSAWLRNDVSDEMVSNWPILFISIFDGVFGDKHFTWRCFIRSSATSLIVVVLMTLITYSLHGFAVWSNGTFNYDQLVLGIVLFLTITFI